MKKRCILFLITLCLPSALFALEVHLNGRLWHHYSPSDLEELRIELESPAAQDAPGSAIPFDLILPLMTRLEGIRIYFPGGMVDLDGSPALLRASFLKGGADGWKLSLGGNSYADPVSIELSGTPFHRDEITVWAETGLHGLAEQLEVWASLHKLKLSYRAVENLESELIHREMTGELIPDYLLLFTRPEEPYHKDSTIAFRLQSSLAKGETRLPLILPSGHKLHPDLFLSLLASRGERVSPFDPGFFTDEESIREASTLYFSLLLNHSIREQDDFFLEESYRAGDFAFFPAESFPRQSGRLSPLPSLEEGGASLSPRVFPLKLLKKGEQLPEGALLDFLKLPGIQHGLLSASARQLPAETEALAYGDLNREEQSLFNEWKRGYILSAENYPFRRALEQRMPDILRNGSDPFP